MRENRTYGSEGGEPSNGSLPYPYRIGPPLSVGVLGGSPDYAYISKPKAAKDFNQHGA